MDTESRGLGGTLLKLKPYQCAISPHGRKRNLGKKDIQGRGGGMKKGMRDAILKQNVALKRDLASTLGRTEQGCWVEGGG